MTSPYGKGNKPETEITDGKSIIQCAEEANVNFTVFSSVASAHKKTGIPHFDSKYEVEKVLMERKEKGAFPKG